MRYVSIDALRMLAIVLLVAVHFAENLAAADPAATSGLYDAIVWIPRDFAAPLFTLLLGVSYRLWVRGRESRGDDEETITKSPIRRGLFLFGLGIAFNVIVWLPEDTFNWDVLTLLGIAMIVLAMTRAAPPGVHLLAAAAAAAVSPALREVSDYALFWTSGYFDPDLTLAHVGLGLLCTGYFPVFPWIAYPLVGYAVAPAVFPDADGRASWWPVASGAVLMANAAATLMALKMVGAAPDRLPVGGWSMFPATSVYVCFTLGAVLVALPLAHRFLDYGGTNRRFVAVADTFSRHALTIYLLHHVIHLWPLWAWGMATADDPTEHWRNAMPMTAALGFAAAADERIRPTRAQADAVRRLRARVADMPVPQGLERRTIRVGAVDREYFLHVPAKVAGKPAPVVFALHGGAANSGVQMHLKVDYTKLADTEGFVVVYPSGVAGWNIGSHDAYSVKRRTSDADDLGFFQAMFDALTKEGVADPKRIYVTGGSNGGVMTQYLACAMPERIAGIGVVVATLPKAAERDWPKPSLPMPALVMLGTEDRFKPWEGNADQFSAAETVAFWRKVNACGAEPVRQELPDRDPGDGCRVTRESWPGGAPVVFYTLAGHGHGWPMQRGGPDSGTGPKTRDISAPEELWVFLEDKVR